MQQFTLSKEWAFACQNPQKIPQHLHPSALEQWLGQYVPRNHQELTSPFPYLRCIDDLYPSQLRGHLSPPVLFYRGNTALLKTKKISIVGTRKASIHGIEFAKLLSSFLAIHNIISVSGLAYGIDEIVHQQDPAQTIGVLPCGFGSGIPRRMRKICNQIIDQGGLLLSEFPPNSPPRKWRFIQRNRIISWLGDELILVEAPVQSGALHTVRYALEREKKIWVVPSSPLTHSNHGGMALIAAGFPVLSSLQQLAIHLQLPCENLNTAIISYSEFARYSNMTTREASRELTRLQIKGAITPLHNGYFVWNPSSQS